MIRTFYFFAISLYWVASLENDRWLKLIRVIDAVWSIYTRWMYHLPDVSSGKSLLVYKAPEMAFVWMTNVWVPHCSRSFRNSCLFDTTTSFLYFLIHHRSGCSFLHNKISVLFNLLSPWPPWYMAVVLFCIPNWPLVSPLPLIQSFCDAGIQFWDSEFSLPNL